MIMLLIASLSHMDPSRLSAEVFNYCGALLLQMYGLLGKELSVEYDKQI